MVFQSSPSNLSGQPLHRLRTVFGYDAFRPHQEEIIDHLVAGGDALVLMPTGGGKSLCYQIPALVRPGVGIIISPLIALMQDQVQALRLNGVRAAFLNSSLTPAAVAEVEAALLNGELEMLYVAPERLMMPRMLALLARVEVALFAIDEAHCVAQWGHDFRPEYIQLSVLHERFPAIPRVALTATADMPTRNEIKERLALHQARSFISGFDRPNIRYRISENQGNARDQLLRFIRNEHDGEAGIVYCLSRKRVDEVAAWLAGKGLTALPYHAGLSAEQRQQNQQRFVAGDGVIIVATIAFGMGIDKPDVRFVAHLNMPKSLEAYYQETGRAGRDGLPADAWMLYGLQDVITLRQMQATSQAAEAYKRVEHHKLEAMLGFVELTSCRRQALLRYFNDHLEHPCGNCDTCLDPPQTWDASVAAQKALSCVHRTGQRFGVNYLVDVLQGKSNERMQALGHDRISTFGIGDELDQRAWRNLYRQLIARSLLAVDVEGHGGLRLTEASRPLLRGEQPLELRQLSQRSKAVRQGRKVRAYANDSDSDLWAALRDCRNRLATEQGVPAYMIFHDATLMALVERRPETLEQLRHISGIGERKRAAYGKAFLAVLREYEQATVAAGVDTVAETLRLFRQGQDVATIARLRELKPATIYAHLEGLIAQGQLQVAAVVNLPQPELNLILNAFEQYADEERLKPVYEALEAKYDYGLLRCIRAALTSDQVLTPV
jgi:ATP-dependent DNA helicase RecQ